MAEKIKMYEIDGHHIRFKCCDNTLAILYNESDSLSEPKACPFCGMNFGDALNVATDTNKRCEWIPVTEQLPKFYPNKVRAVLVTMVDDCGKSFTTTAKYNENHGYWYDFNDYRFMDFKVMAWMPKPDAYIEQEEEA